MKRVTYRVHDGSVLPGFYEDGVVHIMRILDFEMCGERRRRERRSADKDISGVSCIESIMYVLSPSMPAESALSAPPG